MNRKRYIRPAILVLAALAALWAGVRFSFLPAQRIAFGVRLGGVDLGGLTRAEAAARLKPWSQRRLSDRLTFVVGSRQWTVTLRDLGVLPDCRAMARSAYSVGRSGRVLNRIVDGLGLSEKARSLPALYRYDWKTVSKVFEKMNDAVGVPAQDARISFAGGVRTITPEVPGITIDLDGSAGLIQSALQRGEGTIVLPVVMDEPEVTAADLQRVDTLLSRYSTRFPAWRRDRTHNLKLAISRINGSLVRPGQVFSYNDAVGPRQRKTGFKDALIYMRGKIIPGTGGGVCQVSSTLYNAALLANLRIVERNHHSMPVPYVRLGRDATVAYGLLDLKFKNTSSAPVYIMARVVGSRVSIEIYGARADKRDVRIVVSRPVRTAKGGRTVTAVSVQRVVSENGTEVSRERISYDRYLPAAPHPEEPKPRPVGVASRA